MSYSYIRVVSALHFLLKQQCCQIPVGRRTSTVLPLLPSPLVGSRSKLSLCLSQRYKGKALLSFLQGRCSQNQGRWLATQPSQEGCFTFNKMVLVWLCKKWNGMSSHCLSPWALVVLKRRLNSTQKLVI